MLRGLTILLFTLISSLVGGLTRYDKNTCFDTTTSEYVCCSNYEEINDKCIKCKMGFISRKGSACKLCPLNFFGKGCLHECKCINLQRCNHVKGCVDIDTTSTLTTESNTDEATCTYLQESVTNVQCRKQTDDISKTEILKLYSGISSVIIVLLGILLITNCLKKRSRITKSKNVKNSGGEVHSAVKHTTKDSFALHKSLYETIDDNILDTTLVKNACRPNLEKEQKSSRTATRCNIDQSSFLYPSNSHTSNEPCSNN